MNYFQKARAFVKKNENYITPVALFGGFIIDSLTLQRIDLLFENVILGGYLLLSGILVYLISFIDSKEVKTGILFKIRPFLGIVLLFVFGGIFSGFTVFYTRSASITSSWPFLLILVGVMVGTEYAKKYFTKNLIQISVFYFALYSYLIFLIPIIVKKIGPWVFLLSGLFSLILIFIYFILFQKTIGKKFVDINKSLWKIILGIFVLINILYFLNIIPPIPLSLKEADVYHYVERKGNSYSLLEEKKSWWQKIYLREPIHIKKGQPVYVFSSVFAPTKLNTQIIHEWQWRDEKGKWHTSSKIPFSIYGGRDGGYRGYSVKSGLTEGRWRVNIETPNGQIIGRKSFKVIFSDEENTLESIVK